MADDTRRNVTAVRALHEVAVIDTGGSLAIHFEAADTSDTVVLLPTSLVGTLIAQLRGAEMKALAAAESSGASPAATVLPH